MNTFTFRIWRVESKIERFEAIEPNKWTTKEVNKYLIYKCFINNAYSMSADCKVTYKLCLVGSVLAI